jgi:hypothetical protein
MFRRSNTALLLVIVLMSIAAIAAGPSVSAEPPPEKSAELPKCDSPKGIVEIAADPTASVGAAGTEIPYEVLADLVERELVRSGCYAVRPAAREKLIVAGRLVTTYMSVGMMQRGGRDVGSTTTFIATVSMSLIRGATASTAIERSMVPVTAHGSTLTVLARNRVIVTESPKVGVDVAIEQAVQMSLANLISKNDP